MKRLSLTALLCGALLTFGQPALAAPPERIPVVGVSDLLGGQVGGAIVPDKGGNLHLKKAAFVGGFELHGDGVDISGSQQLVLTGVLDRTLSGPVAGRFSVTAVVNGRPATIWEGAIHGRIRSLSFTGRAIAHGEGPYAGQKLVLHFLERPATPENPNPEVFDLTGTVTRRS
jgi:hypothetical protein